MKSIRCPFCNELIPARSKTCPICCEVLPKKDVRLPRWGLVVFFSILVCIIAVAIVFWSRNTRASASTEIYVEDELESATYNNNVQTGFSINDHSENSDESIPEGLWTQSNYKGTLSGGGKKYGITLSISYPGLGEYGCPVQGGYQYDGHTGVIPLEGEWMDLAMGRVILLVLSSKEYRESFSFELEEDDLVSSGTLTGTWEKYTNEEDFSLAQNPDKKYDVRLMEIN